MIRVVGEGAVGGMDAGGDRREATSTRELLVRARGGEPEARERLFARLLAPLRQWARGRLSRRSRGALDTEDLVQDALLGTMARLDRIEHRGPGAVAAYARQIILNRLRDEQRRHQRRDPAIDLDPDLAAAGATPEAEALEADLTGRVRAALSRLSPEERALLAARLDEDLDFRALAERFGKASPDAARMAFNRALARLAEAADVR